MTSPQDTYLKSLDGWRAVSILLVMLSHAADMLFGASGALPSAAGQSLAAYGLFGVQVFFGISGLLICSRLLDEEATKGRIDWRAFFIRRATRILPPVVLFLACVWALGSAGLLFVEPRELLASLLFFRNYLPVTDARAWYTGHFWSLAVEEHFYLLLPLLWLAVGSRRLLATLFGLALAVFAWRAIEARYHLLPFSDAVGFSFRTDVRLDGLLWGCLAALALRWAPGRTLAERLNRPGVAEGLTVLFIVMTAFSAPLMKLWQAVLIALTLLLTTLAQGQSFLGLLEWRPLRWVGRISYSLYIWQQLFLTPSVARAEGLLGQVQQSPVWSVALAFVCAMLSYYCVERPCIEFGRRLATRRAAVVVQGATS